MYQNSRVTGPAYQASTRTPAARPLRTTVPGRVSTRSRRTPAGSSGSGTERRHQAGRLTAILHDRRVGVPKIVLGDFNEWMKGLATSVLNERLQSIDLRKHLKRRRTYPGVFPVLHLDHIYHEGNVEVEKVELPRTRLALMASDHLPLVADLRVQFT